MENKIHNIYYNMCTFRKKLFFKRNLSLLIYFYLKKLKSSCDFVFIKKRTKRIFFYQNCLILVTVS